MSFEDDLRLALRREQAPADFAARVMAKAAGRTHIHAVPKPRSAYQAQPDRGP